MNIKTKRLQRLLILGCLAGLILLGLGGFSLYRRAQVRRYFATLRLQGLAAARQGKNEEAINDLFPCIQRSADDTEVLEVFARIRPLVPQPKNEHLTSTIFVLRQLLKLEPQRRDERIQLLHLYVRMGFWAEADQTAQLLLPAGATPGPDDVPILADWTQSRLMLRNYLLALAPAAQWNRLAPVDLDAQLQLLQLVNKTQRYTGILPGRGTDIREMDIANAMIDAMTKQLALMKANAPDPRPLIVRAYALLITGHQQEAADQLHEALKCKLVNEKTTRLLISTLDQAGLGDEALTLLKQLEKESHDPISRNAIARRDWEAGDLSGVAEMLGMIDANDETVDPEILGILGESFIQLGRLPEAQKIRSALLNRRNDLTATAWAGLLGLSPSGPGSESELRALALAFESALKVRPSAYLSYFLGSASFDTSDYDRATSAWRDAASQAPNWLLPTVRFARLLADTGRYQSALQIAREGAVRAPHSGASIATLAYVWNLAIRYGADADSAQLLALVDKVRPQITDHGELLWIGAELLGSTGKTEQATQQIKTALASPNPLGQTELLQLAAISQRFRLGEESACLARCKADHGVTPELVMAWAVAAGNPAGGLEIFEAERAKVPQPQPIGWRIAWCRYLDAIQDPRAVPEIERLADAEPGNLRVQLQLRRAGSVANDAAFQGRIVDRLGILCGKDGVIWPLARARWLAQFSTQMKKDAPEAARLLENVIRLSPDLVESHVLLGRCDEQMGLLTDAIGQMKIAEGLSPASASMRMSMARLLQATGDFDGAREELGRIAELSKSANDKREAADMAAKIGDPRLALALTESAALQSSGTDGDALLLAQRYSQSGRYSEAETICQKLLRQPHPSLQVITLTADLLATQGRMDDATQVLGKLDSEGLAPGIKESTLADFANRYISSDAGLRYLEQSVVVGKSNPTLWMDLTLQYLAGGRAADAASTINRAARELPNDPKFRTLQKQLEALAIADADPKSRGIAIVFARNPDDVVANDSMQFLLAQYQSHSSPQILAAAAKAFVDGHPQFVPLHSYLIECYLAAGKVADAIEAAARAAQQFPGSISLRARYVELLRSQAILETKASNQQSWVLVINEAQKWRDRSMMEPLAADLHIAEAAIELKQPADAMRQLEGYIHLGKGGAYEAALPLYARAQQEVAASSPSPAAIHLPLPQGQRGRQIWMTYAVEYLDDPEAAAWLDQVAKLIPPEATGEWIELGQMWGRLGKRHNIAMDFTKSEAILQPLADRPDARAEAVIAFAWQLEAKGDRTRAEPYYRRALTLKPDDVTIRNNLAMLIANSGGDLKEAAALAQGAVKLQPSEPSLYDTLAFVEGRLHDFDHAVEHARMAIRLTPLNPQYHITLARLLLDAGKTPDAIIALQEFDAMHLDAARFSSSLRAQIDSLRGALQNAGSHASAK